MCPSYRKGRCRMMAYWNPRTKLNALFRFAFQHYPPCMYLTPTGLWRTANSISLKNSPLCTHTLFPCPLYLLNLLNLLRNAMNPQISLRYFVVLRPNEPPGDHKDRESTPNEHRIVHCRSIRRQKVGKQYKTNQATIYAHAKPFMMKPSAPFIWNGP